jgi:hypothetical protein
LGIVRLELSFVRPPIPVIYDAGVLIY